MAKSGALAVASSSTIIHRSPSPKRQAYPPSLAGLHRTAHRHPPPGLPPQGRLGPVTAAGASVHGLTPAGRKRIRQRFRGDICSPAAGPHSAPATTSLAAPERNPCHGSSRSAAQGQLHASESVSRRDDHAPQPNTSCSSTEVTSQTAAGQKAENQGITGGGLSPVSATGPTL